MDRQTSGKWDIYDNIDNSGIVNEAVFEEL